MFGTLQASNPARPRSVTSRNRVRRESRGNAGREAFTGSGQAVVQSPEMDSKHESRGREFGRRQHLCAVVTVGVRVSTGSKTMACARGDPREPGRACRLRYSIPVGRPVIKTQACPWSSARGRERMSWSRMVSPSEGNEARREGRQAVGVPHSTAEAGEPTQGTLWREGGIGTWNRWRDR